MSCNLCEEEFTYKIGVEKTIELCRGHMHAVARLDEINTIKEPEREKSKEVLA